MRTLAIETSGPTSSVALLDGEQIVSQRSFASRMTLNQRLAGEVRAAMGYDELSNAAIDAIGVGIGPGSFTGVRMGVAMAKAISHALGTPLVGVSAPEAIATAPGRESGTRVLVLQKARAEELYATCLTIGDAGIAREAAETEVLTLPRALQRAEELLGEAPDLILGDLEGLAGKVSVVYPQAEVLVDATPCAASIARVAADRADSADPDAHFSLTPRYVRLSQAERQFGVDLGLGG